MSRGVPPSPGQRTMHRFVPAIRVSAIVVNYRRAEMTRACLTALADSLARAGDEDEIVDVFGACGGTALVRRRMLDDVGGMDESFFFALDDADLAWRARMRGWRAVYAPGAVVYHHHGATTPHGSDQKYFHVGLNRVRMLAKNAGTVQLKRYGPAIVGYDLAYIAHAAVTDRTLAPLRGSLQGLRACRAYRRPGWPRGLAAPAPPSGP